MDLIDAVIMSFFFFLQQDEMENIKRCVIANELI